MAFPDGASVANSKGKLPLHYLARNNVPVDVVNEVLCAYPAGATVRDAAGELPVHRGANLNVPMIDLQPCKQCLFYLFLPFCCPCYCYFGMIKAGFKIA